VQVHLTIDVAEGSAAARASSLRSFLASLGAGPAFRTVASTPLKAASPEDRIDRGDQASAGTDALALLAERRAAVPGFVTHGALRVPAAANRDFDTAVRYLRRDASMRRVIARVEHAHTAYTLKIVHNGDDRYEPDGRTVVWDPYGALRTTNGGRQSPALGLGHELAHAAVRASTLDAGMNVSLRGYDNAEERRVIRGAEARAAKTLGEAARFDHRGTCYRVASPVAC
jgi:hypothetical protein